MAKPLQRDFTQGSIPRHLVLFALPMLAGNMLQVMHNMIDAIWVERFVGPEALGSVHTDLCRAREVNLLGSQAGEHHYLVPCPGDRHI